MRVTLPKSAPRSPLSSPILHGVVSTGTSVQDVDDPMDGDGAKELKGLFKMAHEPPPPPPSQATLKHRKKSLNH